MHGSMYLKEGSWIDFQMKQTPAIPWISFPQIDDIFNEPSLSVLDSLGHRHYNEDDFVPTKNAMMKVSFSGLDQHEGYVDSNDLHNSQQAVNRTVLAKETTGSRSFHNPPVSFPGGKEALDGPGMYSVYNCYFCTMGQKWVSFDRFFLGLVLN